MSEIDHPNANVSSLQSAWKILMETANDLREQSTRWHGGSFNMAADFVEQKAVEIATRLGRLTP